MRFFLGLHGAALFGRCPVPTYISVQTLERCKGKLPRALAPWSQDSEGFTSITKWGGFKRSVAQYAQVTRKHSIECGMLEHASIQDYMCENVALDATGLNVATHQIRTAESYIALRDHAPDLPWMPVLQGWESDDYLRCIGLYFDRGVDLSTLPRVGVGSVCRRQAHLAGAAIIRRIAEVLPGIKLHAFGFKLDGLRRVSSILASSDSMAWSANARHRAKPLDECLHNPKVKHKNCANCLPFALRWRDMVVAGIAPHSDDPVLGLPPLPLWEPRPIIAERRARQAGQTPAQIREELIARSMPGYPEQ